MRWKRGNSDIFNRLAAGRIVTTTSGVLPQDDGLIRYIKAWQSCGITYRQADHWVSSGMIITQDHEGHTLPPNRAGGSGKYRYITREELEHLRRMARLVQIGFKPEAAARVSRSVRSCLVPIGVGLSLHIEATL